MERGKPSPEIIAELDHIAFPSGFYDFDRNSDGLKLEKWRTCYGLCFKDGEWSVSAEDAIPVARMGMSLCLVIGLYAEAVTVGHRLLTHPGIKECSEDDLQESYFWYGGAQLCVGEDEAGCRTLRRILEVKGWGKSFRQRRVLGAIAAYAETMNSGAPVPEPVRELVRGTLLEMPRRVRPSSAMSQDLTMGDLFAVLNELA